VVVRFPPALRDDPERLDALPVTSPLGAGLLRLGSLAELRRTLGPSLIRRENVARVAMVTANVEGADLAGVVERARLAVDRQVALPRGYRVTFGGQFEEAARSARNLAFVAAFVLTGMYGLLDLAFRNHRDTLIVLVNLPLALIGGVFAIELAGAVLSVATAIGFVTLFGARPDRRPSPAPCSRHPARGARAARRPTPRRPRGSGPGARRAGTPRSTRAPTTASAPPAAAAPRAACRGSTARG
jgi:Cu/Ag efflux pump CusA